MRLIRGAAPGASLGENWAYMRDKGRPTTAGEVAAFADAKSPMPPSRAHLKRLARCHEPASEKRQALAAVPEYDFFKSQIGKLSQLGAHKVWEEPKPLERAELVERGVARPLTEEQQSLRVSQLKAEFHRLAHFQPKPTDPHSHMEEWRKRRRYAFRKWQEAENAFGA